MDLFGTPTSRGGGYWQASTDRWRGTVTVQRSHELAELTDTLGVPRKATWTFEGHGEAPSMAAEIEVNQRTPEIRSFTITASPTGRGLQSIDFRSVDVDSLIRNVLVPYVVEVHEEAGGWEQVDADPVTATDAVEQSRKRRRRITTATLEKAAEIYRTALHTRRPLHAVAAYFGVEHTTAKSYIRRARDAGLLPATEQGRAKA